MFIKRLTIFVAAITIAVALYSIYAINEMRKTQLVFISNDYQKGLGDRNTVTRLKRAFESKGISAIDWKIFRRINKLLIDASSGKKFFTIIQLDDCNAELLADRIEGVTYIGHIHKAIIDENYSSLSSSEKCVYYSNLLKKYDKTFEHLLVTSPDELNIDCTGQAAFKKLISWYPTLEIMDDNSKPIYNKLFFSMGSLWDKRRESDKYFEFTNIIAHMGIADIYGKKLFGINNINLADVLGDAYKGRIKGDNYKFLKVNKEYMGSLIHHSDLHLKSGIPSGKIFESTSIKRGVISDKHPWVMKHFGDTIFYVDMVNLSGEEIAQQIADYHAWMLAHPKEFQEMIEKAYKIYADKFSMDLQVEKLLKVLR
jgi:hypothetical protein